MAGSSHKVGGEGSRPSELNLYHRKRMAAKVDLMINRLFLTTIILLNLAALAYAYRQLVLYCPLKPEPLITSPFIIGVLGGLVSLKVPTCGVTDGKIAQLTNPFSFIGRALTYAFFGPTLLVRNALDFTDYADGRTADKISEDLRNLKEVEITEKDGSKRKVKEVPFSTIADKYGEHIYSLKKYGFLTPKQADKFDELYQQYKGYKFGKEFDEGYGAKSEGDPETELNKEYRDMMKGLENLEEEWAKVRKDIKTVDATVTKYNFFSKWERGYLNFINLFQKPEDLKVL